MCLDKKIMRYAGFFILFLIISTYFIPYTSVKEGGDFEASYETPLLGVLIFHNEFVFGLYVIAAIVLIYLGFRKERNCYSKRK